MVDNDTHDITVLNNLIATTIDSAEGYVEAAKRIDNAYISGSFMRWSADRQHVADTLKTQVSALGGDPEIQGSLVGSAHRLFANLHEMLSSGDDAIIDEIVCSENRVKHKYEEALKDPTLSAPTRGIIERSYVSVLAGHEQACALKRPGRA
jgi:uncharacterized protein (TIGR02284 family)